jgi:class 3 adenylate cyclase
MKWLIIVMIFCAKGITFAQNQQKIDSLNNELHKHDAQKNILGAQAPPIIDSIRVNVLYSIAMEYALTKPDTLPVFAAECLRISQKLQYKKGIKYSYFIFNRFYYQTAGSKKALEYALKAFTICKELEDKEGMVYSLNRIGGGYDLLGNPAEALTNYLQAKTLAESIGDSIGIATSLNNIGGIYSMQRKTDAALKYFLQSIPILERNRNKEFALVKLFQAYQGVGNIYIGRKERLRDGIQAMEKAMVYAKELGFQLAVATTLGNIGVAYRELGENNTALKYFKLAKIEFEKTNNADDIAWITILIGENYQRMGKLLEALKFTKMALPYAMQSCPIRIQEVYEVLSTIYGDIGNYKDAFEYQKKAVRLKDSLNASKNLDAITQAQLKYEYKKNQDSIKAEQSKKDLLAENELQKQKLVRNGFIGGFTIMILFSGFIVFQRNRIKNGKKRSDELLLNILPAEVAEELKEKGSAEAKFFDNVTVLFTDFKSFTTISQTLSPQELVNELHACFKGFDQICTKYNIEKIKTIGDAYLAVCGLPNADDKHAEKVILAALEIREFMEKRKTISEQKTFEIRIGINSGSVVAGIVGMKKFAYDIWGDTVNTAARMEQNSQAGKINISETTYSLVKDSFTCEYRGEIEAKNKGKLKMYFVEEYL